MALSKIVDGKKVDCSPEEEAAIRAEWEANASKAAPTAAERVQAYLSGNPVLVALLDELAESRGVTRAAMIARLAGRLA